MLLSLAAAALPAVTAAVIDPVDVPALTTEATEWVLSGQGLPDDYLGRLAALPPDQRLLAIVFLRRAGLLDGPAMPVDALLAPPSAPAPVAQGGGR